MDYLKELHELCQHFGLFLFYDPVDKGVIVVSERKFECAEQAIYYLSNLYKELKEQEIDIDDDDDEL